MKRSTLAVMMSALMAAGAAHAGGSIFASEPGSNGSNINTKIFNGSSYEILKLTFDFTNSHTSDGSRIVIDGTPWSLKSPDGGSATFFGSGSVFGFTFTGFTTFEKFSFSWDPDSLINASYVASNLDFVGASVTAETTSGKYFGVFEQVGTSPDVTASLSPSAIPEPQTYALALGSLVVFGGLARRRQA